MSFDIDMESYGRGNAPAAAAQQVLDTNSYNQEAGDYPVNQELLDQPEKSEAAPVAQDPNVNPQAEHFRSLREEVDRIKAEREAEKREHQLQLDMLRANLDRNSRPEPQAKVQERQFLDGMKEEDIPNVGELRREWEQKESMYQSRLEELQTAQMHPDYAEVLEKYVVPLVKQKPHLAEGIQGARNKSLFAYELGKMAQAMQQQQAPAASIPNENAQRIVENSRKPGTLSQAGGQGALSKADYFASMSYQEFMRMASKNLDQI